MYKNIFAIRAFRPPGTTLITALNKAEKIQYSKNKDFHQNKKCNVEQSKLSNHKSRITLGNGASINQSHQ